MGMVLDLVAECYSLATWGHILSHPIHNIRQKSQRLGGSARDWIQPVYSCKMGHKFCTGLVNATESFQNQLPTEVRDTNACIITLASS